MLDGLLSEVRGFDFNQTGLEGTDRVNKGDNFLICWVLIRTSSSGTIQSTLFPWYVAICEGADLTFLSLMLCAVQGRVMVPPSVAVKDSVLLVSSCPLLLFSGKEWMYKFVSISWLSNCEYVAGLDLLQTLIEPWLWDLH